MVSLQSVAWEPTHGTLDNRLKGNLRTVRNFFSVGNHPPVRKKGLIPVGPWLSFLGNELGSIGLLIGDLLRDD